MSVLSIMQLSLMLQMKSQWKSEAFLSCVPRGTLEPQGFGPWVRVPEVGNVTLGSNERTEHPRLEALFFIWAVVNLPHVYTFQTCWMSSGASLRLANGVRYLSGATRGERRGTASGIARRLCPWYWPYNRFDLTSDDQYIRYVELSAHSRSKCTMQMTLYRVASIASPCENFQEDDIITASLLYRTQFRVQIQGLIFQSLIA